MTRQEVRGWGTGRPRLGSPGSQGRRRACSELAVLGGGGVWRSSGRPGRRLSAGLAKKSEPPSGTAGPTANSRGRPRAGTRSRGPALASGEMSPLRPRRPQQGGTPRPLLSLAGAPTSSTPGARSGLRLRQTTQDRPAGRPRCPQPPGHARKALGPRVRPRHPPGRPRDSTARVSPGPAQRSRPLRLPRLLRQRPRRTFHARTGSGSWDRPAPSRGPWARRYLDVRGVQTGAREAPARRAGPAGGEQTPRPGPQAGSS